MDLGSIFSSLFGAVWRMLSLRISFRWLGAPFSFTILQILLGVLIISLGITLVLKIIHSKD